MYIYYYDPVSGIYKKRLLALLDQVLTLLTKQNVYLMPLYATTVLPPLQVLGYKIIWNGLSWLYRSNSSYLTVLDYDKAMLAYIKRTRLARGYTTREPSYYLQSSVARWAQDAKDWVAFIDDCMLYGLDVQNKYAAGLEVPTLELFVLNLPVISWTYNME